MVTEKESQNRKAFTAALAHASRVKSKLGLGDQFSIEPPQPVKGEYYFLAPCRHCGQATPIIEDPFHDAFNPFGEDGSFRVKRVHCDEYTVCPSGLVFSGKWSS